ncbi:hypothetical protein DFH29DRAFT_954104 [Suillus ampliporus]|nr:hypothetical protein DFH29DRAFT_954104 [Suillus ampliporus]
MAYFPLAAALAAFKAAARTPAAMIVVYLLEWGNASVPWELSYSQQERLYALHQGLTTRDYLTAVKWSKTARVSILWG